MSYHQSQSEIPHLSLPRNAQMEVKSNVNIVQNGDEIKKFVDDHRLVVCKLHANWCGPCKTTAHLFERLASEYAEYTNIAFLSVDIDECHFFSDCHAIPKYEFFVDGERKTELAKEGADVTVVAAEIVAIKEFINRTSQVN